MLGLKAKVKEYLRGKGLKTIELDNGSQIKLQNAKTSDLLRVAIKLGY